MANGPVQALGSLLIILGLAFVWHSAPTRFLGTPGRTLFGHHTGANAGTQNARQLRYGWTGLALAVSGLTLKLFSFWM
jgi:hypothetical protein